jgi:hypothetical protein
MTLSIYTQTDRDSVPLTTAPLAERDQKHRIMAALGVTQGSLPRVDEQTLSTYFRYLAAQLSLPFAAWYPEPKTSAEKTQFRCNVVELLDPAKHMGDQFDGIFCKTRKGTFEVNLPLIELHIPQDDFNFQLIEDYWYWFWNWR